MKNEYRICDKCKGVDHLSLTTKIKEFDPDAKIIIGCQNFCGIGRTKSFVILNHMPIIAETEDELINKIKEKITQ